MDRVLYLPTAWTEDAARRGEAGIPEAVQFATKGALARPMLQRAFAAGVPARWVVGDTVYGTAAELRPWLEVERRACVLAVPRSHRVWLADRQVAATTAMRALPADAWQCLSAGEGSQGPRWYDWAWIRLAGDVPTGWGRWLLARRSRSEPAGTVPHVRPRRVGNSSTPSTVALVTGSSGTAWTAWRSVPRPVRHPRRGVRRAPGRPPSARSAWRGDHPARFG